MAWHSLDQYNMEPGRESWMKLTRIRQPQPYARSSPVEVENEKKYIEGGGLRWTTGGSRKC